MGRTGPKPQSTTEKFWKHIVKGKHCWSWSGRVSGPGYGVVHITGTKRIGAHRLSWQIHRGEIPPGMFVCHRCDNPPCCNPDHLFLGTQTDNMRDASSKGRCRWNGLSGDSHYLRKRTHCKHGHPFDDTNTLWLPDGTRQCRACTREAGRRWRSQHKTRSSPRPNHHNSLKTHCKRGHALTAENVYIWNHHRTCKTCRTLRKKQSVATTSRPRQ